MDVGDNRHEAAALAQFGDDVLQIRRVLHRRRGDADELAADGDEFERLLHALGGVHRVAGEHGLHDDGMVAADDDAAARRIADDDFAGLSPVIKERGFAVAHVENLFCRCKNDGLLVVVARAAKPVAGVEEGDVKHERDEQRSKAVVDGTPESAR